MHERDYDAYDLDDPKHPDYADAMADWADMERKREKEDRAWAEEHRLAELARGTEHLLDNPDDPALD